LPPREGSLHTDKLCSVHKQRWQNLLHDFGWQSHCGLKLEVSHTNFITLIISTVNYPLRSKQGASPVLPAFTADGFIWEFRAGSRQPHPIGLFIRGATLCSSLSPQGDVIGNIPSFCRNSEYLKLLPTTPTHLPLRIPTLTHGVLQATRR